MTEDKLANRASVLAKEVVSLSRNLRRRGVENSTVSQLLRAGTSVWANVNEAHAAQGRADFAAKLQIASKECKECDSWLWLLYSSDDISQEEYKLFHNRCIEINRILCHSIRTARKNEEEMKLGKKKKIGP